MLIILLPFIASKYISKKSKNTGLCAPVLTIKMTQALIFNFVLLQYALKLFLAIIKLQPETA